jgi:outer membrane protein assembly factor BamB
VNNSTKLAQQWSANGAGAYDTTPAISQGVIYIGDKAGTLSAFAETTGDTLFTVSLGSAIESSPAVDSGEVFVGDDGGNLSALNATTGAPLWTDAIGGKVPTPTVYDGTVYVGSAAGDVYAINEVTGAIDWTASLGGAVASAPAINPVSGSIIATTQSGVIEAISPTKGAVLWSDSVGGALTGAMIYRSDVFVGSSNGSLYAINAKSGVSAWSVDTGAAVSVPPIITETSDVSVANAADNISYYDAFSGSLINTTVLGVPITGLASTGLIILVTSTSGLRLLAGPFAATSDWVYSGKGIPAFDSPGVLLNGNVFAAGDDGTLRAYTIPGRSIA